MPTWDVELRGTITRDIKRMECDALTAEDVSRICAEQMPSYRVHAITLRPSSGVSDTTGPAMRAGTTGAARKT